MSHSTTATTSALGICLGASTVTIAERQRGGIRFRRQNHEGRIDRILRDILPGDPSIPVGVTGRKFRDRVGARTVSEPETVEIAFGQIRHEYPEVDAIVSAGGETFLVYRLDRQGKITSVHAGNKCASGTGEFFLQQLKRMDLGLEEAVALASEASPYALAGRCSVFCKSDCTHALNKGVGKGPVSAGLCKMIAGKIVELLQQSGAERPLVIGGVSLNRTVMAFLHEIYPETAIPPEAPHFEALGALLWAEREKVLLQGKDLAAAEKRSFAVLPELASGLSRVAFKSMPREKPSPGEHLIGLDVGSTTTKAILLRRDTRAIVAGAYLRTNGDPIAASRQCYRQLLEQTAGRGPEIVGLAVTGSGRRIAGLHGLTEGIVNEIVAHAEAAVFFDPDVDTIFEIGGQDAKYTRITNRVAVDYAMNEACSAGTGSFLEEACRESLGIEVGQIADIALDARTPPNFNDQCSAFIGSDIKTAVQEGIHRKDLAAGLVYSVCQNYLNRVKGHRPTGTKIFMQGGVCYNRAVPVAMAILCGREIVVPPEPGLMGAFGAALVMERKLAAGLLEKRAFSLADLAKREVTREAPFVCEGGRDNCDLKCTISRIRIEDRSYPFGGACSRYDRRRSRVSVATGDLDFVRLREELVYRKYAPGSNPEARLTVGIPPSLLTNTLYPLYAHFFNNLGLRPVVADASNSAGIEAVGAAYCHPVAQSHGFVKNLLAKEVDYLFIPHVKHTAPEPGHSAQCTCPFVQGEPYVVKAAFYQELADRLLTAVLYFDQPKKLRQSFRDLARQMGRSPGEADRAFTAAWKVQETLVQEMHDHGRRFLASLEEKESAVVLFGRPYNAFSRYGNLGIPHKLASLGYRILPHDFLPPEKLEKIPAAETMYWPLGRRILRAAAFVANHPALFGVYVTNFSCGPDSFLLGYFRELMGQKPSLTLELDAHLADAGVDTRIEAFLDVLHSYRELNLRPGQAPPVSPARIEVRRQGPVVVTGDGRHLPLTDPKVHVLFPSMGRIHTPALAAAMRREGIRATALEPAGPTEHQLGKAETSGKECLPLLLTTGSLLRYLNERKAPAEVPVFFMPRANGPCRFGQYHVFLQNLLRRQGIEDVAVLSLSGDNGYAGMSASFTRRAWTAIAVSDGLDDIRAAVLALARDPETGLDALERAETRLIASLAGDDLDKVLAVLEEEMERLAAIPRKRPLAEATRVSLLGEIFVRRDDFSRQNLVERLADHGIVVKTAPITEWLHYVDYCMLNGLSHGAGLRERLGVRLKQLVKNRDEERAQNLLARSGFYEPTPKNLDRMIDRASDLLDPNHNTEAALTVSAALTELGDEVHGVISIGPFGCMPCRVAEGILNHRLAPEKERFSDERAAFWKENRERLPLPFLAVETDGNAFTQLVQARLEGFILAAKRLHEATRHLQAETASGDKVSAWGPVSVKPGEST